MLISSSTAAKPFLDVIVAFSGRPSEAAVVLLHASGPSLSDRASFTLQVRFGNFLDPVANEKGGPGSMRRECLS